MQRFPSALSRSLVPLVALTLVVLVAGGPIHAKKKPKKSEVSLSDQLQLAQSLMDAGRVGDSLAVVNEALKSHPENAQVHALKGKLTFQAGKYAEAEAAFRKALELDPYMTDAHNYLGVTLNELGRYGEAEAEYKRALEDAAYPTPENVYLNLGILYATQKRDDEAIAALRRAVEINPRFYKAHFELAAVLDRQGQARGGGARVRGRVAGVPHRRRFLLPARVRVFPAGARRSRAGQLEPGDPGRSGEPERRAGRRAAAHDPGLTWPCRCSAGSPTGWPGRAMRSRAACRR